MDRKPFSTLHARILCLLAIAVVAATAIAKPIHAQASTWDPTLLVNTEAFHIIDDGDGSSNIYLQFGDAANERLLWSTSASTFLFTDDLQVQGDLTASGSLTINADDTGDATLTFGNDAGDETITFNDTTEVFDVSDDLSVTGDLTVSGTVNGVDLAALASDGSGSMISLHPAYTNAVYEGSGSTTVGQLKLESDNANSRNHYRWTTTRSGAQRYDVVVRVRVPENFSAWQSSDAVTLAYRTNTAVTADNSVQVKIFDTAGAMDYDSGELASTSFADETADGVTDITGTYTPGSTMTVRVTLKSTSGDFADAGYLNLNWATTTP